MNKVYLINPEFSDGWGEYSLPIFFADYQDAVDYALESQSNCRGCVSDSVIIKNTVIEMSLDDLNECMFR